VVEPQSHALADPPSAPVGRRFGRYGRYALALLIFIGILNYLDRQIINILVEPIRQELGLRDWQVGLMTGFSFGLLYSVLGIPIARLAERGDRPMIIAASVALWSAFTVACGFTQSFLQLILVRVGVGVGEAGCTPTAHSLISEYTPREKRASALSLFAMAAPIASLLGMAMGGLVADLWGWRAAFLIAGAPGLLAAILVALTLPEPRRQAAASIPGAPAAPSIFDAALELRTCRTFRLFCMAGTIQAFISYGHYPFLASFFIRNHGPEIAATAKYFHLETTGFLGVSIGLALGVSGIVGAVAGGLLGDRLGGKDPRALAAICAGANLLAVPTYIAAMLVPSAHLSLVLLAAPAVLYASSSGPMYAVMQSVVQPRSRATASALYLLFTSLLGLGFGPLLVGILSDYLSVAHSMGPAEGIRWSQIICTMTGLFGAYLFWRARKSLLGDLVS